MTDCACKTWAMSEPDDWANSVRGNGHHPRCEHYADMFETLEKRIAELEAVLREWRAWYRETKPYHTRIQLEQMTDKILEAK